MCLILFAFQQHPDYPLVVIANRDEYYARPTESAGWWLAPSNIHAGRDLQAGGTWLGVNRAGRFAAVTNVREAGGMTPGAFSRGELPPGFLSSDIEAENYIEQLEENGAQYAGYNLLFGDQNSLWFQSNRDVESRKISAGIYGVSNGRFDEGWPKLASGRNDLEQMLRDKFDVQSLLSILTDDNTALDEALPATGVSLDVERLLSSRFIRSTEYGTRACTVVLFDRHNRCHFIEQNFVDAENKGDLVECRFDISSP
ncbi:MAG: hypothetical protein ACI9LO_001179 [Planctomycetota bacterium]|jgi:uncharacterized protein with NRDE domain